MDYQKVGNFIKSLRNEKGMTQKELAQNLSISDKTVSKWETGNGLPDIENLQPLCGLLGISINELLSGEKLPENEYTGKAEENMIMLLKENKGNKKLGILFAVLGVLMLLVGLIMPYMLAETFPDKAFLVGFIDVPSLLMLVLAEGGLLLLSGSIRKGTAVTFLRKTVCLTGLMFTLIQIVYVLGNMSDIKALGPNIAVCMIALLYASIAYLVLRVIENRQ